MFRKNDSHYSPELYNVYNIANNTRKRILENHWSDTFHTKIFGGITEDIFEPLYCGNNGRPNFPVNILAGLEILKSLFELTDEELYENYHFNVLYQRALGAENINDYSFSIRTLYNFRASVCDYEIKTGKSLYMAIFKDGRDSFIEELNIKTNIQRTDSVMIGADIKRMNRFTLLHKTLSNFAKDILKHTDISISDELRELISQEEDSLYYRLKKMQVKEKTLKIAEYLYIYVERFKDDEKINQLQSYQNANRVLYEQCNVKENKVQLITHIDTVENNQDDAKVLNKNLKEIKEETDVEIIINDGAFVSRELTETCKDLEIEQVATAIRGKEMSDAKLTSEDFIRNEEGLIEACPAGNRPEEQTFNKTDNTLTAKFDVKVCNQCKLKERCMAYKSEKQSKIEIDSHREFLDKRQKELGSKEYLTLAKLRPNVEATVSRIKPKYLKGRILFRGLKKVSQRMILKAVGVNFKRYFAWILYFFYFFRLLAKLFQFHKKFIY